MGMPMRPGSKQGMFGAIGRLFRHRDGRRAVGRPTPGAVPPAPRRGGRGGLRGPGGAARADGPGGLPPRPERPARRPGCLPGDVPRPGAQGRHDPEAGVDRRLALRRRPPGLGTRRGPTRRVGGRSSDAPGRAPIVYEAIPEDPDVWDEVERLPQDLRAAVVLCYLEGLTHEQAARRLGWPVGTVRSRLARARDRLRTRLTRRGLAPDAAFLPMLAFRSSSLPQGSSTHGQVRDADRGAATRPRPGWSRLRPPRSRRVLRTMLVTKLKSAAATLLAAGAIASGVGLYAYQGPESPPTWVDQRQAAPAGMTPASGGSLPQTWTLTRRRSSSW